MVEGGGAGVEVKASRRSDSPRCAVSFRIPGHGAGNRCAFSANDTRSYASFRTHFDWRSENEHQEPSSRLRCGSARSLRCPCRRRRRRRRAGAPGICAYLRRLRHRLLLHPRHRDLPEDRRPGSLRNRRHDRRRRLEEGGARPRQVRRPCGKRIRHLPPLHRNPALRRRQQDREQRLDQGRIPQPAIPSSPKKSMSGPA